MNMGELETKQLENETGSEVAKEVVQSIPGTAPTFDAITEEELLNNKVVPKVRKQDNDPDVYKATSSLNKSSDSE